MNLKHGTIYELEKAFKDYGVAQGQMLTKTIRFFVEALTECGFELSPHIPQPRPRAPTASKKNGSEKSRRRGKDTSDLVESETPPGFERLYLPGAPNSFIQYPADLTEADCNLLEGLITVLRAYAEGRAGEKGEKA